MLVEKTSYEIVFSISKDYKRDDFDIIYMMGGNTIYLLDMIRKYLTTYCLK